MAKPKLTKKAWVYKAPHIGMAEYEEIQNVIVRDYIKPQIEAAPPLLRLEIIVKTTR